MPRPAIEQTLIFDRTAPFQSDWQGVCANYMGFAAFPEFALSAAQKQAEWDRVAVSGVKIVRTFYDVSWAFGGGYPAGPANWTSANMLAFYEWIAAMKDRAIKVVINAGWSFTGSITIPFAGVASAVTPTPTHENAWAAWMSETLNQLLNVRGYDNVSGVVLFTEPNFGAVAEPIPVGYTGQEYYVHLIDVLDTKIRADDAARVPIRNRISLIGGQEQGNTDPWVEYLAAHDTRCDVLSAHSYVISPAFAPLGLAGDNDLTYAQLVARFAEWAADASPRPFWVDEGGTVVGGDTDSTGYRATADYGWRMCGWFNAHMQAGVRATFPWTLQDEKYWPSPANLVTQQFGVAKSIHDDNAVRPAFYALAMFASLTGGGSGTTLYRSINGTDLLHGTGIWIPPGVRRATASGEWTFVVVNDGALPVRTQPRFRPAIGGRTIYRYVYGAEVPPAMAATPAYAPPWDQFYPNISGNIPPNVVPGRSVAIYSTINLGDPASVNLALSATATSDSTGFGSSDNVNDGNFSNVQGAANGWKKADNASHYVELTWPAAQTIGRIKLAFVATTPGVVYATYTDASTPSPVADYTVKYWNGSAFVDFSTPVNVAGNTAPNNEHTFAPVSTTKIRLTVTSAAATGQVNQLAAYAS